MIYVASMLLESALFDAITKNQLLLYGIVILIAISLRLICDRQASYASYEASVDVKRILREKIYGKLLKLGASYRESVATSEVVQMAAEGVEQLETYFGKYLSQFSYNALCYPCFCKSESKPGAFDLCPADSTLYRSSTEICKKIIKQILGNLYRTGRFFPGESAGIDNSEDLSG